MNVELKKQLEKMTDAELYSSLLVACNKQVNLNKKAAKQFNIYNGEQIAGEAFIQLEKAIKLYDGDDISGIFEKAANRAFSYSVFYEKKTESKNFEFYSINQSADDAGENDGNNILDLYLTDYINRPTEKAALINTIIDSVIDDKTDATILNCIKRGEPLTEAEKLAGKSNRAIMQRKAKLIKRLNEIYTEE